jgi:hypothetical protein
MEGWLHQTALPPMKLAFAGQQTFAQHGLGQAQAAGLYEVPVVRDQYVLDEFRVVHQKEAAVPEAKAANIDTLGAHPSYIREEVATKSQKLSEAFGLFNLVAHSSLLEGAFPQVRRMGSAAPDVNQR